MNSLMFSQSSAGKLVLEVVLNCFDVVVGGSFDVFDLLCFDDVELGDDRVENGFFTAVETAALGDASFGTERP